MQWDKMHRSFNCENCVFNNLLNCGRKKASEPKCTNFSMSPIKIFLEKPMILVLLVRIFFWKSKTKELGKFCPCQW